MMKEKMKSDERKMWEVKFVGLVFLWEKSEERERLKTKFHQECENKKDYFTQKLFIQKKKKQKSKQSTMRRIISAKFVGKTHIFLRYIKTGQWKGETDFLKKKIENEKPKRREKKKQTPFFQDTEKRQNVETFLQKVSNNKKTDNTEFIGRRKKIEKESFAEV